MSGPLKFTTKVVTPEMAKKMLEQNTENFRRLDKARVARYAIDMIAGRWEENGETIKFNGDHLIDGQHRLAAIVSANKPIRMSIASGVASAMCVDTGKARSVADWLSHLKLKNTTELAASARLCVLYAKGMWNQSSAGAGTHSSQEVIEFATAHNDGLQDAIRLAKHASAVIPKAMFSALLYLGSNRTSPSDNEMASWFANALATGESLTDDQPVLHLRNRLLVANPAAKLSNYMTRMLLTVAWNKTVKGEATRVLRLRLTGPMPETPPNVIEVSA